MRRGIVVLALVVGTGATTMTLGAATQVPSQDPPITSQQIARGDSIFRGKAAGGTCFTCHQLNAKGLPGLAPDLTDANWIHGDGSYDFIVATIQKGVPKPKQANAPMLPRGGTSLNDGDIRAVAAYVYSLRNAKK
jgi:mono/diheme cytochrome c family protein